MVLHGFGKAESQVQFLLGAPDNPARGFLLSALSSMDRMQISEVCDRGSILLGPANK